MTMLAPSRTPTDRYYGVEFAEDGALVVADRSNGHQAAAARYPGGQAGASALRERISRETDHPHICIRAHNGAALALATALMSLPGSEVTIIASRAIEPAIKSGREAPAIDAEERARRLARLAERLF
jgi:hypothetical protein